MQTYTFTAGDAISLAINLGPEGLDVAKDGVTGIVLNGNEFIAENDIVTISLNAIANPGNYELDITYKGGTKDGEVTKITLAIVDKEPQTIEEAEDNLPINEQEGNHYNDVVKHGQAGRTLDMENDGNSNVQTIPDSVEKSNDRGTNALLDDLIPNNVKNQVKYTAEYETFRQPHTHANSRNKEELGFDVSFGRLESRNERQRFGEDGDRNNGTNKTNVKLGTGLGINDTVTSKNTLDDEARPLGANIVKSNTWAVIY